MGERKNEFGVLVGKSEKERPIVTQVCVRIILKWIFSK
jgi:hypothetical protein